MSMVRYARHLGLAVPVGLLSALHKAISHPAECNRLAVVTAIHRDLLAVLCPATARIARLMCEEWESPSPFRFLGNITVVRRLVLVALTCLPLLAWASLSGNAYLERFIGRRAFTLGMAAIAVVLGAAFSGLFDVNRALRRRTFDPAHQRPYWLRTFAAALLGHASIYTLANYEEDGLEISDGRALLLAGLVALASGLVLSFAGVFDSVGVPRPEPPEATHRPPNRGAP